MALRTMEGQIEEFVEGFMARAFGSDLQPVEIGRRLRRVAVRDRRVNVKGVAEVANHFVIGLGADDYDRIVGTSGRFGRDLADEVRTAVGRAGLALAGPLAVDLEREVGRRRGTFSIRALFDDSPRSAPPAVIELHDGNTIDLDRSGARIGRHHDNDIAIDEPNVSRFHAQIVPIEGAWYLVDNGSTNGTRVNGSRTSEHELVDGDLITVGPAPITFRLR